MSEENVIRKNYDEIHFVGYQNEPPHPSTVGLHLCAKVLRVLDTAPPGALEPNCTLLIWYDEPAQNPNPQHGQDNDAWKENVPYDPTCTIGRTYHRMSDCKV